jgi:hypothetical protein
MYNVGDYPTLPDSAMDSILQWGTPKQFWWGGYASPHEVNQYEADSTVSDAVRNADTTTHWLYLYASDSLSQASIPQETLVVHVADDMVCLDSLGDPAGYKQRRIEYDSLGYAQPGPQSRWTYQLWDNQEGHSTWLNGITWLANSPNADARGAIVYAYRRKIIEDSADYGSGKYHWTILYADNYYRTGTGPILDGYFKVDSSRGGISDYIDWVEQDSAGHYAGAQEYYDNGSLVLLDALDSMFVAEAVANSFPDTVKIFANVDKANSTNLGIQIKETSVHFELIFEYAGAGWNLWKHLLDNADTLRGREDDVGAEKRYAIWEMRLDISADEGEWYTMDRLVEEGYAFFMINQSSNQYIYPSRFDDTTKFRGIYEVDFGTRCATTFDTTILTGSCDVWGYGDCLYLWEVKYDNAGDSSIILFCSGRGGETGQLSDTFAIYLNGWYNRVSVDADTAEAAVDTAYIRPCEGWFGVRSEEPANENIIEGTVLQGVVIDGS